MQSFDMDDDLEISESDLADSDDEDFSVEPDVEETIDAVADPDEPGEQYSEIDDTIEDDLDEGDDDESEDEDDEDVADEAESDVEDVPTDSEPESAEGDTPSTEAPSERLPRVRRPRRGKHRDDKTVSDIRREQAEAFARSERDRIEQNNFIMGWDSLASAKFSNTIIDDGEVGRVFYKVVNGNSLVIAEIVLERMGHKYKVLVPYEEFFSGNFHVRAEHYDLTTHDARVELTRQRMAVISKFIGQKVPICILDMQEDGKPTPEDHYIQGSRRKALEIITNRYYVGTSRANAIIHAGSDVSAEVVSTSMHSVTFNVYGIDVSVSARNLSHRFLGPEEIRKYYQPGMRVLVRVESVRPSEEKMKYFPGRTLPYVIISRKPIEREAVPKQAINWSYGDNALARITTIDRRRNAARPIADIWIETYDVPGMIVEFEYEALMNQGRTPQVGDRCVVYLGVTGGADDRGDAIISYDKGSNKTRGVVFARFGRFID